MQASFCMKVVWTTLFQIQLADVCRLDANHSFQLDWWPRQPFVPIWADRPRVWGSSITASICQSGRIARVYNELGAVVLWS